MKQDPPENSCIQLSLCESLLKYKVDEYEIIKEVPTKITMGETNESKT